MFSSSPDVQSRYITRQAQLLDEAGGFSGSLGMIEDISDRKLAERRLTAQHAVASAVNGFNATPTLTPTPSR